jgi:phosphatidylglycerol:prolipoprotein diacylglycerol transferase
LPVHPTQLYSLIDGMLIALFLVALYPFRRRDGEVTVVFLAIYPVTRYLMEVLRDDEPGMFNLLGLELTIAQAISLGILLAAVGLWLHIRRQPAGRAFDRAPADGRWAWTLR